jgi:hypothetical protein
MSEQKLGSSRFFQLLWQHLLDFEKPMIIEGEGIIIPIGAAKGAVPNSLLAYAILTKAQK